jgi:hypothetical protein
MVQTPREKSDQSAITSHRWLELAVPLFSFGGALLAILFLIMGAPADFRISILGCVIASWVLAYLAWMRPKKDIVALSTPIYSFIFISVPTDTSSAVILELLYAISLTILLVRLKYRFGKPGTAVFGSRELTDPLKTYVEHTRESSSGISPETAHLATLAFVRFAEGEYKHSAQFSGTAAGQLEDAGGNSCLTRAFKIVKDHATLLDQSLPRPQTYLVFSPEDACLLAKPTDPAHDDDREFYAVLDNALLLVFSAAWNNSERDRPHLLACQVFAQKLLSSK